jgi:hypothetical protein
VRCVNCHAGVFPAAGNGSAPHLDKALLLTARQRRGGPPSAYDAGSFCKLLRTGVDPAFILIAREMPVYMIEDSQCNSLWRYFVGKDGSDERR